MDEVALEQEEITGPVTPLQICGSCKAMPRQLEVNLRAHWVISPEQTPSHFTTQITLLTRYKLAQHDTHAEIQVI